MLFVRFGMWVGTMPFHDLGTVRGYSCFRVGVLRERELDHVLVSHLWRSFTKGPVDWYSMNWRVVWLGRTTHSQYARSRAAKGGEASPASRYEQVSPSALIHEWIHLSRCIVMGGLGVLVSLWRLYVGRGECVL